MAYYRAGEVIKLNRIALNMTQEQLCEGICSVKTLSRIENGWHNIKKTTYEKLMEKMGHGIEKNFAICIGKDVELLEERILIEESVMKYDYEGALKYLNILKEKKNNDLNTDIFVKRMDNIISFHNNKIDGKEQIYEMEKIVEEYIPNYRKYINLSFPFMEQEIVLLMNLANAYTMESIYQHSINIYIMLIRSLNKEYMDKESRTYLKCVIMRNLAYTYARKDDLKKSLILCKKSFELAKENNYGVILPILFFDISWYMIQQIEKGERELNDLAIAKNFMRQAYYIAAARNDNKNKKIVYKYFNKYFNEEI